MKALRTVLFVLLVTVGMALPVAARSGSAAASGCVACNAIRAAGSTGSKPTGYSPQGLRAAYHLPYLTGSGGDDTVAVIGAGVDPQLAADLAVYRSTFGLPACTVASGCLKLLGYKGGNPVASEHNPYLQEQLGNEASLDVQMVSAACPTCHLLYVAVPWQDGEDDNDVSTGDFARAADTAVQAGADVLSVSYGYTSDVNNVAGRWAAAFSHAGVASIASSGDNGFTGGVRASWPADLPTVTAVGGVSLPRTGAPTAWDTAGSGCEQLVAAAQGQPAAVTADCAGHRAVSDVSADADPATGVAVYDSYAPSTHVSGWSRYGGTSAATPYIAGLYGRVDDTSSVDGPDTVYTAPASAFTDVTSGQTLSPRSCSSYRDVSGKLCRAAKGWDGPTGRGVPDGLAAF